MKNKTTLLAFCEMAWTNGRPLICQRCSLLLAERGQKRKSFTIKVSTENFFFGFFGFSKFSVFRFFSKTEKTENPKMRYTVHLFRLLKPWPCMYPKLHCHKYYLLKNLLLSTPYSHALKERTLLLCLMANFCFKFPLTSYRNQF
jgi:hypothetical protein